MDLENFESNDEQLGQDTESNSAPEQSTQDIVDLDSLERFRWKGEELTRDELEKRQMLQQDYTRKRQESSALEKQLQEKSKYIENWKVDLENIRQGKASVEDFKRVYPEEYHFLLDQLSKSPEQHVGSGNSRDNQGYSQELNTLRGQVNELLSAQHEARVEAAGSEIDSIMNELGPKYDLAKPKYVMADVFSMIESGTKVDKSTWEKVYKYHHEEELKSYKGYYSKQFKKQKEASEKAKDIGPGGSAPTGGKPKLGISEITKNLMRQYT